MKWCPTPQDRRFMEKVKNQYAKQDIWRKETLVCKQFTVRKSIDSVANLKWISDSFPQKKQKKKQKKRSTLHALWTDQKLQSTTKFPRKDEDIQLRRLTDAQNSGNYSNMHSI